MSQPMPTARNAFNWQSFTLRFAIPIILTIVLFILAIFFMLIPLIEENSMNQKREMIQELTRSAWNNWPIEHISLKQTSQSIGHIGLRSLQGFQLLHNTLQHLS